MTAPLRHELVRQVDKSFMKFPWEKGRLAKVLGKDATIGTSVTGVQLADRNPIKLDFVRSDDQRTSVAMSERYEAPSSCLFTMFVRDQQSRAVNVDRESRRDAAVDKWVGILKDDYEHSLPGRQALNESLPSKRETYLKSVVNATFLLKSPGTLLKRYYAIRAFVFWMHDRHSRPWLPMLEIDAWSYVRSLAKDGAAATKGNSFLEAARFCHFVLGITGADNVVASLRVKGLSAQLWVTKRPWQPASVLTVDEVLKLHSYLMDETNNAVDRLFVGHLLLLLYSRSRWSDLANVTECYLDEEQAYVEIRTKVHTDLKSRLLPIVAPAKGIDGSSWAVTYMGLRDTCGLGPVNDSGGPVLPAPLGDDECIAWTNRALSPEEGSRFLRHILEFQRTPSRRVSPTRSPSIAETSCPQS